MDEKQLIQDEQYDFPYHYIPEFSRSGFSQTAYWSWGYRYLSGINLVLEELKRLKFSELIDIGCGDGRFLKEVKKLYPSKNLLGVDYSSTAIQLAEALTDDIDFEVKDITTETVSNLAQVATLIEVLEHIPPSEAAKFLESVRANISAGATLLLTVPHSNKPLIDKHYRHFHSELIRKELEPCFEIEEIIYFERLSKIITALDKLLANRLYILNNGYLWTKFYKIYVSHFMITKEESCGRILVRATAK